MMNFRRLGALCAVTALAGLAACDDNEINTPDLPQTGLVRVANTSFTNGESVDVYANGTRILADIGPGEVSEFVELESATYGFAVTLAGSVGDTIQADSITLLGGLNNEPIPVTYLVYDAGDVFADPLVEVFRRTNAGEALLRLHVASPSINFTVRVDVGDDDDLPGGEAGELNLSPYSNSEDLCPAGCAGGFSIPAGQNYPIALYRRQGAGTVADPFVWTKAVFNVNIPQGEGWNAVLVGSWFTATGANRLRLFVYDMDGNFQIIEPTVVPVAPAP